jgi:hypothetical protein
MGEEFEPGKMEFTRVLEVSDQADDEVLDKLREAFSADSELQTRMGATTARRRISWYRFREFVQSVGLVAGSKPGFTRREEITRIDARDNASGGGEKE